MLMQMFYIFEERYFTFLMSIAPFKKIRTSAMRANVWKCFLADDKLVWICKGENGL